MARYLATKNCELILVARNKEKLEEVKDNKPKINRSKSRNLQGKRGVFIALQKRKGRHGHTR